MEVVNALGRRKRAIARIFVSEGTGKITINKRDLAEYFPSTILQYVVKQPLNKIGAAEKYDIKVNLCGGGFTGQSQALRLAIARALVKINAEDKAALRAEGFMTRDPRSVERKKPGQPIHYWKLVATSDTLRESGILQWLLIFSWNAMVFTSLTSTKQLQK